MNHAIPVNLTTSDEFDRQAGALSTIATGSFGACAHELETERLKPRCEGVLEGGVQRFHHWNERILSTDTADLDALFRS